MKEAEWQVFLEKGAAALGLRLSAFESHRFFVYMCEMQHWNRRMNLTAINDPAEIAIKHFLDAIAPSAQIPDNARILDVGSGAGFPGIPLKIVRSGRHMTLIDSARKRVNFLRHVIRQLDMDQIAALHSRIETFAQLPDQARRFDVVVSRALTGAADLVRWVLPLLQGGAVLMMWKGPDIRGEMDRLVALSGTLAARLSIDTRAYRLPSMDVDRHLISVRAA